VGAEIKVVSDLPFITLYHTFFSPIIWAGKKGFSQKEAGEEEVSIDEMVREIENFNPDRYRDLPMWWAKEIYKEKISQVNADGRGKKIIRIFYKLIKGKGDLQIEKYYRELGSL